MHIYIISSMRSYRRVDEYRNRFKTTLELKVGDKIELDGLTWVVEEVIS